MPPPRGRPHAPKLCTALTALSPLVGKCSSHRCHCPRCAHRVHSAGLRAIPVRPTTRVLRIHDQSTRRRRLPPLPPPLPSPPPSDSSPSSPNPLPPPPLRLHPTP